MFKINPNPTFPAEVSIPIPGSDKESKLKLIFKHKTRKELGQFIDRSNKKGVKDVDLMMEIIEGWENVDGEFCKESVEALCDNYHQAPDRIYRTYFEQITQAKAKN